MESRVGGSYESDACTASARQSYQARSIRTNFQSEEIFLDMFEDEYRESTSRPTRVDYVLSDASLLLPPTGTPLTGIDFARRLPCGEVERARKAIR